MNRLYLFQYSSVGKTHIDYDVLPNTGDSAGSLQLTLPFINSSQIGDHGTGF